MHTDSLVKLDPWFSIWVQPRKTVRFLLNQRKELAGLVIVCLAGIAQVLDNASNSAPEEFRGLRETISLALLAGPFLGLIGLYIGSWLTAFTGRWIGGLGSKADLRVALAWSNLPIALSLIAWSLAIYVFGESLFINMEESIEQNPFLAMNLMMFGLAQAVLGVWSLIIMIKGVAEVQEFSAWKGLGNIVLASLIILVPLIAIGLLLV